MVDKKKSAEKALQSKQEKIVPFLSQHLTHYSRT